jgi:hypothetical protein
VWSYKLPLGKETLQLEWLQFMGFTRHGHRTCARNQRAPPPPTARKLARIWEVSEGALGDSGRFRSDRGNAQALQKATRSVGDFLAVDVLD